MHSGFLFQIIYIYIYIFLKLSTLLLKTAGVEHFKCSYCNQGKAVTAAIKAGESGWRCF